MPIKPGTAIIDLRDGRAGWLSHYTHNGKRAKCSIGGKVIAVPTAKVALSRTGKPPPARPRKPETECSDEVRRLAAANGISIRMALEALAE